MLLDYAFEDGLMLRIHPDKKDDFKKRFGERPNRSLEENVTFRMNRYALEMRRTVEFITKQNRNDS